MQLWPCGREEELSSLGKALQRGGRAAKAGRQEAWAHRGTG